ncbi:MAG: hypothetical protein RSE08_06755 [Lactococcus sp.]
MKNINESVNEAVVEKSIPVKKRGGRIVWMLKNFIHRQDGPAIEDVDGSREWWINGKLHRNDGPAFESANGRKEWYKYGKLHRDDGPAIEDPDGMTEWFLNGVEYTKSNFPLNKVKSVQSALETLDDSQLSDVSNIVSAMLALRKNLNAAADTKKLKNNS